MHSWLKEKQFHVVQFPMFDMEQARLDEEAAVAAAAADAYAKAEAEAEQLKLKAEKDAEAKAEKRIKYTLIAEPEKPKEKPKEKPSKQPPNKGATALRATYQSKGAKFLTINVDDGKGAKEKSKDSKSNQNLFPVGPPEVAPGAVDTLKLHRYGGFPTISFNLSSRKAIEEGWIVNTQPEPDMDRTNLLEWATKRLQAVIRQKEEEDEEAKKYGYDKPVLIRHYGDSRRDTLLKLYRKGAETDTKPGIIVPGLIPSKKQGGVPKIPQLSKMDNAQKERLMVQLPDGSTSVYYPKNGECAIMASAVPDTPGQLYVHCYGNDPERNCLATFTPYGQSCCYYKNGVPGLVLTEEGGVLKHENGSVQKKWIWPEPGKKLKEPINFQLNKEMNVRVFNRENVNLYFNSNRETVKIPVGASPGIVPPPWHSGQLSQHSALLQSRYSTSLKAAVDFAQATSRQNIKAPPKQHKPARRGPITRRAEQARRSSEAVSLKHSLDPPFRFEFDSQADRELNRLQGKSKHLVDEWMEHYRVAVGISSPILKKVFDKPKVEMTPRKIQSARERKIINVEEEEFDDKTKYQSFRSPSAPPRHMIPGPHSLTVKDTRIKPAIVHQPKKLIDGQVHVRIEVTPSRTTSVHSDAESGKAPSQSDASQQLRQRPSTQVARGHVPNRYAMRASNSASAVLDTQISRIKSVAVECDYCPVATRSKLLPPDDKKDTDKHYICKCSKHRVPSISDLEYDYFLHKVAPSAQLVVVCVVNSLYPDASPYDKMIDHIYIEKNKNRTQPCRQSRHDQYRILRYDLAVAKSKTKRSQPLLLGRHNAVPGMALMYCGGRLVFADHIFNGYGNARNDFRKQVFRSRREYMMGRYLPDDFRFTPAQGKPGPRAAWGGEVGGAGVDGKGKPGMFFSSSNLPGRYNQRQTWPSKIRGREEGPIRASSSTSDLTTDSSFSVAIPAFKSFDTARDFVQYSLSTNVYDNPTARSPPRTSRQMNHRPSLANNSFLRKSNSRLSADVHASFRSDHLNGNFARMQAVK